MTADDLKQFCADREDPRPYLRQPWTRDGYTWATNGHIIIRVPVIDGIPDCPNSRDGVLLFSQQKEPIDWIPVPAVEPTKTEDCENCDGTGTHECSCGTEHDCGECDGMGKVESKPQAIKVGNAFFADHYLRLIAGWEIAPNGPTDPTWIRKGDALGLLMPMRP